MTQSPEDTAIAADALEFVKANRRRLAKELTDLAIYPAEQHPVAVFMAGSPGAGKTEASQELIDQFGGAILRIDPDDYRALIPGYNGKNSSLFQRAVIRIVEKVLDEAFHQGQSFILDGTLSNYDAARRDIDRALAKGREVQILYIYQDPCQAWKFVQARQEVDGRSIPLEVFVDQYFAARDVVNRLKRELGGRIRIDLILKNLDGGNRLYENGIEKIDGYIPETYNVPSLLARLGRLGGN